MLRIRAGISVKVRIRVRDVVRISNRVRRKVKLVNYSLILLLFSYDRNASSIFLVNLKV